MMNDFFIAFLKFYCMVKKFAATGSKKMKKFAKIVSAAAILFGAFWQFFLRKGDLFDGWF